jgi:hypothetical protein
VHDQVPTLGLPKGLRYAPVDKAFIYLPSSRTRGSSLFNALFAADSSQSPQTINFVGKVPAREPTALMIEPLTTEMYFLSNAFFAFSYLC